jgi:hypothetical protein
MKQKWLKQIPEEKGWYISGFVDGEGSFNVSLVKRNDYRLKWRVVPIFNVSQRDITMLFLMKKYLGCGRIQNRKDGLNMYIVENITAIKEKVIPFFKKFSFLSSKAKTNFSIFCQIVDILDKDTQLDKGRLIKVCELREKLNKGRGRKRKYNLSDVEK